MIFSLFVELNSIEEQTLSFAYVLDPFFHNTLKPNDKRKAIHFIWKLQVLEKNASSNFICVIFYTVTYTTVSIIHKHTYRDTSTHFLRSWWINACLYINVNPIFFLQHYHYSFWLWLFRFGKKKLYVLLWIISQYMTKLKDIYTTSLDILVDVSVYQFDI